MGPRSVVTILDIEKFHLRMKDCDLEPEDIVGLREQIRHVQRKTAWKMKVDKKS